MKNCKPWESSKRKGADEIKSKRGIAFGNFAEKTLTSLEPIPGELP